MLRKEKGETKIRTLYRAGNEQRFKKYNPRLRHVRREEIDKKVQKAKLYILLPNPEKKGEEVQSVERYWTSVYWRLRWQLWQLRRRQQRRRVAAPAWHWPMRGK